MSENIGIEKEITGNYNDILAKIEAELKTEGFGVLTRIDVKETLKKKLDVDFTNYTILGACNPKLAFKALSTDKNIGLLLPCNVIVYEKEPGVVIVSAVNPKSMSAMMPGVDLSEIESVATEKLTAAIERL